MYFFRIFRRKKQKMQPKQLRIDGVRTELTPEPDDAEQAARALLELSSQRQHGKGREERKIQALADAEAPKDAEYYRRLADHIRESHAAQARMAMRYVAYCEQELKSGRTPPATLEQGLYAHLDIIEREGGDLKSRWQKCLAEVLVRQSRENTETSTDLTE